jgi:uncharacterized surface protein with fasciclin (FAS1) repeats
MGHASANNTCSTIVDIACNTDGFTTLCTAVQAAGLGDALSTSTFTVFAPTDAAFDALPAGTLQGLLNDTDALTNILLFHAVADKVVTGADLHCTALTKMANGQSSRTVCDGPTLYQKGAGNSREKMPKILGGDIDICNGAMHVISQVMLP